RSRSSARSRRIRRSSPALKRNPNYSGGRPHRLEEIDLAFGVSQQESVARVESGDADYVVDGVPPDAAARLASRFGPRSPAARSRREQYFVNPNLDLDFPRPDRPAAALRRRPAPARGGLRV